MLDEDSKQNIRRHIDTLCKTALAVIEVMGTDEDSDLVGRLEQTAGAIAAHYEMEPELMEEFHAVITASRKRMALNEEGLRFMDAEQAKDMIYAITSTIPKRLCAMRGRRTK